VYDGTEVPPILPLHEFSVVVGSFSKSLSLAGERIGYIAVNPAMPQGDELLAGLILCNRILGYVNAPVIGQRLVEAALGVTVDAEIYRKRRDAMAGVLRDAGIEFALPKGAFYFFPRVPAGWTIWNSAGCCWRSAFWRSPGAASACPATSPDLLHGRSRDPPRRPRLQERPPPAPPNDGHFRLPASFRRVQDDATSCAA
jgi:hypothetical protein